MGRSRNRIIVAALLAVAGGAVAFIVSRRPQPPAPAAEPPRLGYSRNGSAPASFADAETTR